MYGWKDLRDVGFESKMKECGDMDNETGEFMEGEDPGQGSIEGRSMNREFIVRIPPGHCKIPTDCVNELYWLCDGLLAVTLEAGEAR